MLITERQKEIYKYYKSNEDVTVQETAEQFEAKRGLRGEQNEKKEVGDHLSRSTVQEIIGKVDDKLKQAGDLRDDLGADKVEDLVNK
jgi:predicted DNA-binding protein YlxM (UPF0122 family)